MKRTDHGLGQRMLLYSHDTYGLGHLRRNVTLAHAIAARAGGVSILCVTGSPRCHAFEWPSNFDIVKLPSTTKDAAGHYMARSMDVSLERIVEMRARILMETARSFRPDLVLVDHAPAGMAGELRPALEALRRELPATRVWLGLRDIIDSPDRTIEEWRRNRLFATVSELYDRVFVYGLKDIFDLPAEYHWPAALRERTRFTGYVTSTRCRMTPRAVRSALDLGRHRPIVVVQVGGGGDGDRLLRSVAEAMEIKPRPEFETVVLTGPLLSERKRTKLHAKLLAAPRTRVRPFFEDMPALLQLSTVITTMGGYNSMAESLASGKRVLVAPRTKPREEQGVRAARFATFKHVENLGSDQPDPTFLRSRMEHHIAAARDEKLQNGETCAIPGTFFQGADTMAMEVARELGVTGQDPASEIETASGGAAWTH